MFLPHTFCSLTCRQRGFIQYTCVCVGVVRSRQKKQSSPKPAGESAKRVVVAGEYYHRHPCVLYRSTAAAEWEMSVTKKTGVCVFATRGEQNSRCFFPAGTAPILILHATTTINIFPCTGFEVAKFAMN